jgi:hypothetical protein
MSAAYLPGTQVTLVAIPEPGAAFAGWTTCAGQSACTMTMNGDIDVTASFTSQPTLAVSPSYLDFRNVKIGEKAGATFTVKNTATQGAANLIMGTLSISGTPRTVSTRVRQGPLLRADPRTRHEPHVPGLLRPHINNYKGCYDCGTLQ